MIEIVPKGIMENKINLKRDREETFKNSTRNFEVYTRYSDLYLLLSSALEGTAARRLSQIPVDGLTWTKFTEYFLSRFGTTETITSMMVGFLNEQQLEDETTGAFGHRLHSLLWSRWENLTMIEIVNAFVLYRLRLSDKEAERLAFSRDIRTRDQFYQEMQAFSYARKGTDFFVK